MANRGLAMHKTDQATLQMLKAEDQNGEAGSDDPTP